MSDIKSAIEDAYWHAVSNRLHSMVYFALNEGVPLEERKRFRKEWSEEGCYRLGELLINCTRPDWTSYPDTFWIDPWIANHLRAYHQNPGGLCYILNQWLDNEPLPPPVSEDPYEEDAKVRELKRLFNALNR